MAIPCVDRTSVRVMPWLVSVFSMTLSLSMGFVKLGHPELLSNLSVEGNNGSPDTTSTHMPGSLLSSIRSQTAVPFHRAALRGTVPGTVWIRPLDSFDNLACLFSFHFRKFERITFLSGIASANISNCARLHLRDGDSIGPCAIPSCS
jgi:hypothetical protein